MCVVNVDEVHRLKHQNHEELIQKCFVFLEGRQRRKWTDKKKISLNHCFKSLFQFILDLKVRLIEAFPVKAELHNVVGYVYRFKRAAGGYARFLNSLVFQLVQKWHRNQPIYHGLEVREENVFWPVSALILFCFCFMYLATTRLDPRSMVQHVQQVQHGQHVQHIQHDEHDQQDGQAKDTDDNNKFGDEVPIKIYISSSLILSLIIYMLLLQYGISPNPGPENAKKSNVSLALIIVEV